MAQYKNRGKCIYCILNPVNETTATYRKGVLVQVHGYQSFHRHIHPYRVIVTKASIIGQSIVIQCMLANTSAVTWR